MGDKDVLRATTEIKIQELRRHEDKLMKHYAAVETKLNATSGSAVERLHTLHDGVRGLQILKEDLHSDLDTIPDLLALGEIAPTTVNSLLDHRSDEIEREMQYRRAQWRHNKLLGDLLMETLENETNQAEADVGTSTDGEWEMEQSSARVSLDEERVQAQKRLEEYFFTPCGKQRREVCEYLEHKVFQRREHHSDDAWEDTSIEEAIRDARDGVKDYCSWFRLEPISCSDIASLATVLLMDKDQLSSSIVRLLEGAKENPIIQEELRHVLTIKLSNLTEFAWPSKGVPVVVKRAINGRYRSLIEEDAVTFLLFQYIGVKWSIFMKMALSRLLKAVDLSRRAHHQKGSVAEKRIEICDRMMFSALPDEIKDADTYDETSDASEKPMGKQDILRLICTEAHLLHTLEDEEGPRRSMVAVVTDVEFFGPSVSHEVVLGIMEFLGVTPVMLKVFETHLKMPLVFPGFAEPQMMAKGVPVSRKSARFYSELLLFVMDYAVMASSGVFLYRTHDDICYFTRESSTAVAAWNEINSVATAFGLRFNKEKSGSVCVWPSHATDDDAGHSFGPEPLPQQPIKWGLLQLQPDASVKICDDKVEWFAMELAQKLGKTISVLRWVTIYNKYMRFFLRNFGDVSAVFGARHVDNMVEQIKHVHSIVFLATNGDVLEAVRAKIATNQPSFAAISSATNSSLPAGWIYWPLDLGGLGLFNPFLELWSLKQALAAERAALEPFSADKRRLELFYRRFIKAVEDSSLQKALKSQLSKSSDIHRVVVSPTVSESEPRGWNDWDIDESFTVRGFQQVLDKDIDYEDTVLVKEFAALLKSVDITKHPKHKDATLVAEFSLGGDTVGNPNYWMWVAYVYDFELSCTFDTTRLVPRELLPAQLVERIKKAGIYWS